MTTPRLGAPTNGHVAQPPRGAQRPRKRTFISVVTAIKKKGEPEGYRTLRDTLFKRFDELAPTMGAAGVIKLAIEASKHAMMMELHANKQSGGDAAKYDEFQRYLSGETPIPPSPTQAQGGQTAAAPAADTEIEGEPDGEDDED